MKHKLKKWHIVLMSFFALFIAVFTSLFNLKADTVDDETGEVLTDNWELGVVFYDSTIDSGKTPLTEINWDASNGGYNQGEPRVITVQINYKNTSAVTTYDVNELKISIPNLVYELSGDSTTAITAQWTSKITVGANDSTHTGYDWNFSTATSPQKSQPIFEFKNANVIEEKANFEGNIQIVYELTPNAETSPEQTDECIHNYAKTLQAQISNATENIHISETLVNAEHIIASPNWPQTYPRNSVTEWEYTSPNLENLTLYFDSTSCTYSYTDYIYIYDKTGTCVYTLRGSAMAGNYYSIEGNYVKIKFSTGNYNYQKGFFVSIGEGEEIEKKVFYNDSKLISNLLNFNYTRTYTHPWTRQLRTLTKTANKISSLDGFGENAEDYIWVKYGFYYSPSSNTSYPNLYPNNLKVLDEFPAECVVRNTNNILQPIENNTYEFGVSTYSSPQYYYVGYPKSIYNEENDNMGITNIAYLYGTYTGDTEKTFLDDASVSLNLADFEFSYSGNLYGITKTITSSAHTGFRYQDIINGWQYNNGWFYIYPKAIYTGRPMDVKFGDDLMYITSGTGYQRLEDEGYKISNVQLSGLKNGNGQAFPNDKYDLELYVRYAGDEEYTLFFTGKYSNGQNFSFGDSHVVGYYYIIKNLTESINGGSVFTPIKLLKKDIDQNGTLYNFAFIQVYIDGVLQNEPELDSYANFVTKDEIATYDLEHFGQYVQRNFVKTNWYYYQIRQPKITMSAKKTTAAIVQKEQEEKFTSSYKIGTYFQSATNMVEDNYFDQVDPAYSFSGFEIYDLLPEGVTIDSTEEEILNSLSLTHSTHKDLSPPTPTTIFNTDLEEISISTLIENVRNNQSIEVIENWKGTNRTRIKITVDLSDNPILIVGGSTCCHGYAGLKIIYNINYSISYDSFLEYGNTYNNYLYLFNFDENIDSGSELDNGKYDRVALDINENNNISEKISTANASVTITSVISSHQDLTTYVKTDQSNYSTGTVNTSCDSEYQYKLRVRTGVADITNLIIYTNLEEAQPERTRWKGEFLSFDTSVAMTKGYNIKTYYSENPQAGNLYNEDGTLNSDWQEYALEQPPQYSQGLEIKFNSQCRTEGVNWDYIEIYYILNGITYKLGKWGGTDLAGKTIQVPSNDFYLYWKTDTSKCSYYGFSIDSISHTNIENTNTTTATLPAYIAEEIKDNVYPDSAFDSYTHDNYGNSVNKLWHYTYTGEKEIIQEMIPGTDKTKIKSLAFEYLDTEGNPAIVPANSLTYVLINMKSPADEEIKTMARMDCRTQWNAIDEFDRPVDFITGINSNVVKVALPNSVDEDSVAGITLKFTKEIIGTESQFENMKLDINNPQTFMIKLTSLTENEDGSYNQITALLRSDQELIISKLPAGSYLLEELNDNYFDFSNFIDNNDPEIIINGVTFEQTDHGYIITVSEDLTEDIEFNIKVTNEIEAERFYEHKDNKENLFLKNKIESEDT